MDGKGGVRMPLTQLIQLIRNREEGQAMVEYALILSLVSIAAIGVLGLIGTDINTVLTSVEEALTPPSSGMAAPIPSQTRSRSASHFRTAALLRPATRCESR